jgi:hypothetical protein
MSFTFPPSLYFTFPPRDAIPQEERVKVFKSSAKRIFDIKKEEDHAGWPRVKEMLIESDVKNHKELTEESKNELIEFINNLEKEDK